jgi:predicted DCC family thiol-disulfide oxidoreductase YuxK
MKNLTTINVLYDGNCRFWVRITRLVKRLDRGQYIHLTNIADRNFEARIYDKSQSELTAELHVQLSDGTWLKGSNAFRVLFSNSSLRPLVLVSSLPLLRHFSNAVYEVLMNMLLKLNRPDRRPSDSSDSVLKTFSSGSVIQH